MKNRCWEWLKGRSGIRMPSGAFEPDEDAAIDEASGDAMSKP